MGQSARGAGQSAVDMSGLISTAGGWFPQREGMKGGRATSGGGRFWCEHSVGFSPAPCCLLALPGKRSSLFSREEVVGDSASGPLPACLRLKF